MAKKNVLLALAFAVSNSSMALAAAPLQLDPTMVSSAADAMDIDKAEIEEVQGSHLPILELEQAKKKYRVALVPKASSGLPQPTKIEKSWTRGTWTPASQRSFKWYQKINPLFWLGNADDPEPPAWYRPGDKARKVKWYLRNPGHNFTFYVIGFADKVGTDSHQASGIAPNSVFNPNGKWNLTVHRVKIGFFTSYLPFVSYWDKNVKAYFGWRQAGNFGIKLTSGHSNTDTVRIGQQENPHRRNEGRR
jgi:hypothetical protein